MCPRCQSTFLKIRQRSPLENLMIDLTGKRKYVCLNCFRTFRMPDRRRYERDEFPGDAKQHAAPFKTDRLRKTGPR